MIELPVLLPPAPGDLGTLEAYVRLYSQSIQYSQRHSSLLFLSFFLNMIRKYHTFPSDALFPTPHPMQNQTV